MYFLFSLFVSGIRGEVIYINGINILGLHL